MLTPRAPRVLLSLLLVTACLVATASPQLTVAQTSKEASVVAIPDTASGRQMTGWFRAFNSGDPKLMQTFHTASGAGERTDRRAQQDARFFGQSRGLELRKIEKSTNDEIVVLAQAKLTEAWYRVSIKAGAESAGGVQISVRAASNPDPRKLSEAEMLKVLEAYIKKLVAADAFSGTVLVARNGSPIFTGAYGLASVAYKVPNRLDTKFNLGSMNKMFTAVSVCQLAEQGKLAFTDTIGKVLTDYPNKVVAEKVTIDNLLTHSSGIGDYFNEKFMEASRDRFRKIKDYFPLFVDKPLEFEPGSKFRYSNAGFMVLGAIVEKVSGQDYFDYVREHIYKPAGMINTDAYELDRDTPNLAVGYTSDGETSGAANSRHNNVFMHVIKGGPAGGGYSTVEDLLRFDVALRQHKLLSAKYTDLVLAGKIASGFSPTAKYAYGFFDEVIDGKRVVGHGGGFPGINSQLDMYLDNGYTVAIMSNYDPPAAQIVAGKLREMILLL
jgi:CubicO group peptidase (beta-lactamase class C family)